jgi:glycosyltransferase involved in cell wall biosynthesis
MSGVEISVLVPAFNEADSLSPLHEQLTRVLGGLGRPYEILFVDDGSTDATAPLLERITAADPHVRAILLRRNFGKSAALAVGFRAVRGRFVFTMDGDLQDDPEEIPGFLEQLERDRVDLISGWKRQRLDPFTKTVPSRVWNRLTALASGLALHDFNCGFKLYRREVVKTVRVYGELHRFIPVLADRLGFRVAEREVLHHPRRFGRSKFGAARFVNGLLDLTTVMFLGTSRRNPLHVFGRIGGGLLAAGLGLCLYMFAIWIHESVLRVRPLLIGGVILVILGIQFISMGLLAEIIVSTHREEEENLIRRSLPEEE